MNKYKVKKLAWKNVGRHRVTHTFVEFCRTVLLVWVKDVKGDKIHKCGLTVKMAHLCMINLAY